MNPQLIVKQKITAFVNQYSIYQPGPDGAEGTLVAYAQQKRLNLKEKILFYTDESKSTLAFSFRAEKVMDVHGRYFVEDADGKLIGTFRKEFVKSLLVSTWSLLDANDTPVFAISESNQLLAGFRRYAGYIPIVGEFVDIAMGFFRYHFNFTDSRTGNKVGLYKKTTLFRDHYTLLMNDDVYAAQDWRVLAAMAVALDALQSR